MNKFEGLNREHKFDVSQQEEEICPSQPELKKQDDSIEQEQLPTRNPYEKTPEELGRIEEIQRQIHEKVRPSLPQEQPILQNPTEIEIIDGQAYRVEYVPKEKIYPAYGYGGGKRAFVRQDLSSRVKNFVKAHELYHCRDRATWGGQLGRELRANMVPGLKDPLGLLATVWRTITSVDRVKFYLKRIKEGR